MTEGMSLKPLQLKPFSSSS